MPPKDQVKMIVLPHRLSLDRRDGVRSGIGRTELLGISTVEVLEKHWKVYGESGCFATEDLI